MRLRWTTRAVSARAAAAWDVLVDLDTWPVWGPSVRAAVLDDGGRRLGPGATGRVTTVLGPSVPFRVTGWDDGRSWAWAVAGVPATGHRVDPLGPDRCRVGMGVPLAAAPYLLVCAAALRRIDGLLTG